MNAFHVRLMCGLMMAAVLAGCSGKEKDPVKIYNAGVREYNAGNYPEAIGMFKWAMERKGPEWHRPQQGLAKCYLALARKELSAGNYYGAYSDLEHAYRWAKGAVDAGPGNSENSRVKVEILKAMGEVEGCIAAARDASALAGPSAHTLLMLAETYMEMSDLDNAEIAMHQAYVLDPKNVNTLMFIGRLYDKSNRYDQALEYYEKAYSIDRNYPGLIDRISAMRAGTDLPTSDGAGESSSTSFGDEPAPVMSDDVPLDDAPGSDTTSSEELEIEIEEN
jgi:tetratricopeptide (TPR) repeat protein